MECKPTANVPSDFSKYLEEEEEEERTIGTPDIETDDLYVRKINAAVSDANVSSHKFLPKSWIPGEELHWKKANRISFSKQWYKEIQGFRFVILHALFPHSTGPFKILFLTGPDQCTIWCQHQLKSSLPAPMESESQIAFLFSFKIVH